MSFSARNQGGYGGASRGGYGNNGGGSNCKTSAPSLLQSAFRMPLSRMPQADLGGCAAVRDGDSSYLEKSQKVGLTNRTVTQRFAVTICVVDIELSDTSTPSAPIRSPPTSSQSLRMVRFPSVSQAPAPSRRPCVLHCRGPAAT